MKKLTAEELEENYNQFINIIEKCISSPRKEKVLEMMEEIGGHMVACPASGKSWYHGAYAGGYLVHVLKVVTAAMKVKKLYEGIGGNIDFTDEELIFSALFHDLGKIGDGNQPNYIPQDSDWHRKNQGSMYKNNPDIDFMLVPQRSLFVLQKYGIPVDQKEYLAILTHDGLFEETNKPYWISFSPDSLMKTILPKILHAADMLAAEAEYDEENNE
jgi:hypothetical protein